VDPAGARARREDAEREQARVRFFRSHGGGSVFGRGLPADEALRSESNIGKRALGYQDAGMDERMDLLRVLALVDAINGRGPEERVALWRAERAARAAHQPSGDAGDRGDAGGPGGEGDRGDAPSGPDGGGGPGEDGPGTRGTGEDDDTGSHGGDGEDGAGEDDADGDSGGSDGGGPGRGSGPGQDDGPGGGSGPRGGGGTPGSGGGTGAGSGGGGAPAGTPDPGLPSLVHLTLPLADLLDRRAQRPGEAPGYGSLDPALVRQLAHAAIRSPRTRFCPTLTDDNGHAAARGCARLLRQTPAARGTRNGKKTRRTRRNGQNGPPGGARDGPGWDLTPDATRPGPPGGHGSWILTLPEGRRYRLGLHPIPLEHCGHARETRAYRPGRLLRRLVQVRDGECTFTGCSRPARESDFEHAIPYDKGGRTDFGNAGARSRRCHRAKQIPGWAVTQPQPGWHQWKVPSGRTYTKGPKRWPA
jgi:hypothetical protein